MLSLSPHKALVVKVAEAFNKAADAATKIEGSFLPDDDDP